MMNVQKKLEIDKYQILGSDVEDSFDEITHLAAEVCEAPIAMISFIDGSRM